MGSGSPVAWPAAWAASRACRIALVALSSWVACWWSPCSWATSTSSEHTSSMPPLLNICEDTCTHIHMYTHPQGAIKSCLYLSANTLTHIHQVCTSSKHALSMPPALNICRHHMHTCMYTTRCDWCLSADLLMPMCRLANLSAYVQVTIYCHTHIHVRTHTRGATGVCTYR